MNPIGPHCPVNLSGDDPYVVQLSLEIDDEGFERGERIHGFDQCPKCGLWYPCVEEPDMWELDEETGIWRAEGWWGGTFCEECGLLLVTQPDGTPEAYDLGSA